MERLIKLIETLDQLSMILIQCKFKLLIDDLDKVHVKIWIDGEVVEVLEIARRHEDLKNVDEYLCEKYLGYE